MDSIFSGISLKQTQEEDYRDLGALLKVSGVDHSAMEGPSVRSLLSKKELEHRGKIGFSGIYVS